MTDYMYLCYKIHPTDLIKWGLVLGRGGGICTTKRGIINGRNYKWNTFIITYICTLHYMNCILYTV